MSKSSLSVTPAVLAFAALISVANAQSPMTEDFIGLPPAPQWIKQPTTSEATKSPSTPKPIVRSLTPADRPNDELSPLRVVEIPLPPSFPAEAIWGATGRDTSGHIWVGVSTRGYGPSAHLLEYAPDTGKFRDRGDVVSELKHAGVWRVGEEQTKIHTKIFQAEDGYLYFRVFRRRRRVCQPGDQAQMGRTYLAPKAQ